ncbi:MAG: phenylacetic acid degradation protein [Chloroflexi bacterium]|nr:phenylacetic acid degradation protein [Chloroflexota bacterium]
MDTQWPRFIVFLQERANAPHQYVGSVHAPDADMALMNARDVFVRRPACLSLWVVPASAVLMKTAEELARETITYNREDDGAKEPYFVFYKLLEKGTLIHSGEVDAGSPAVALAAAYATDDGQTAKAIWVFPAKAARCSTSDDIQPMFAPARAKTHFRDQAEFHITTTMQQIKRGQDDDE